MNRDCLRSYGETGTTILRLVIPLQSSIDLFFFDLYSLEDLLSVHFFSGFTYFFYHKTPVESFLLQLYLQRCAKFSQGATAGEGEECVHCVWFT